MFPELDLYYADPAQHLVTSGNDLSDLCDGQEASINRSKPISFPCKTEKQHHVEDAHTTGMSQ